MAAALSILLLGAGLLSLLATLALLRPDGPARWLLVALAAFQALVLLLLAFLLARRRLDPVLDLSYVQRGLKGYVWYLRDRARYRAMGGDAPASEANPQLHDRIEKSAYDAHYFHLDNWALRRVIETKPPHHVDVGSRVDTVAHMAAFTPTTFVDIRPLEAKVDGLTSRGGNITQLPYPDRSLPSLSCLHVAEHIGLGRYGDPLDPDGTRKACAELARVLAPGGNLFFAMPVGRPRTCFNAHRIHDPREVAALFPGLALVEFSGVDDAGEFRRHRKPEELAGMEYACGMYWLRRPPT